jgi:hypothetical protein
MKTFTARQLNHSRQEIREAIQDGGCIVQFKYANREIEFECVMIPLVNYYDLLEIYHAFPEVSAEEIRKDFVRFIDKGLDGRN